jgi:hypothetical protein
MAISKVFLIVIFTIFFTNIIQAQDSLRVQDPQPVVITQDGYTEQINIDDIPLGQQTFRQRLKYGGSVGPFAFSNFQTVIGISPLLGYKLTNSTIVGAGLSLIFLREKFTSNSPKVKNDLVGFSGYIRQDLPFTQKLNFPLHAIVEAIQFQGIQSKGKARPGFLVGLGMGNAGGYGLQVLYDLNYKFPDSFSGSFNDSPLVIRVTGFFN